MATVINNIEVKKSDFENLTRTISHVRNQMELGNVREADFMLEMLQNHIDTNLEADNLASQKIDVGDRVRIINFTEEGNEKYLTMSGTVMDVDKDYLYPYTIAVDGMKCSLKWLWKATDLRLI